MRCSMRGSSLAAALTRRVAQGAYPISGSFSRSALNDEVGATSPVAVLVVAFLVGIVVKIASVAPIFYYLPQVRAAFVMDVAARLRVLTCLRYPFCTSPERALRQCVPALVGLVRPTCAC